MSKIYLTLINVMTVEVPREEFKSPDGEVVPNLTYVTLGTGDVKLSELRTELLKQCPVEFDTEVEAFIQHQKESGADDDTVVFQDNGVAPILHIAFLSEV